MESPKIIYSLVYFFIIQEAFDSALAAAGDKLVVVHFTAKWSAPCRRIAPQYEVQI